MKKIDVLRVLHCYGCDSLISYEEEDLETIKWQSGWDLDDNPVHSNKKVIKCPGCDKTLFEDFDKAWIKHNSSMTRTRKKG